MKTKLFSLMAILLGMSLVMTSCKKKMTTIQKSLQVLLMYKLLPTIQQLR